MPPQFYRMLVEFGYTRFFVAADQNQQITERHSSRRDIETELDIDTRDVIELKYNYRNSTPVAKLARAFHTGDPASPPPDLPGDRPGLVPLLLSYAPGRFPEICRRIVRLADRDPRRLVGVIAPDNETREGYLDQLRRVDGAGLDHGAPVIETFYGSHRPDVRFDEGGILVINAQACKGLEFDVAVLADIDRHRVPPTDLDAVRKRFYVMVSRARERVILLRRRGVESRIEEILPDDPDVLQRKGSGVGGSRMTTPEQPGLLGILPGSGPQEGSAGGRAASRRDAAAGSSSSASAFGAIPERCCLVTNHLNLLYMLAAGLRAAEERLRRASTTATPSRAARVGYRCSPAAPAGPPSTIPSRRRPTSSRAGWSSRCGIAPVR